MDISLEYGDQLNRLRLRKARTNVGIFGSYLRFDILSEIKEHLKNNVGFSAFMANDLSTLYPKRETETQNSYNRRLSEKLVEISQIHVFFFFTGAKDEPDINQSVTYEISHLYDITRPFNDTIAEYVIVYPQRGVKIRSLIGSLIEERIPGWTTREYEPNSILEDVETACNSYNPLYD